MIRVGVTGTRQGANLVQLKAVEDLLCSITVASRELHHGGCVGVDEQVAILGLNDGWWIVEHPPLKTEFAGRMSSDVVHPPKNYLVRNRAIVNAVDRLLIVPRRRGTIEGGTGYTFRYAVQRGVPALVVWPDGELTLYDPDDRRRVYEQVEYINVLDQHPGRTPQSDRELPLPTL